MKEIMFYVSDLPALSSAECLLLLFSLYRGHTAALSESKEEDREDTLRLRVKTSWAAVTEVVHVVLSPRRNRQCLRWRRNSLILKLMSSKEKNSVNVVENTATWLVCADQSARELTWGQTAVRTHSLIWTFTLLDYLVSPLKPALKLRCCAYHWRSC